VVALIRVDFFKPIGQFLINLFLIAVTGAFLQEGDRTFIIEVKGKLAQEET
jgi:uncharacterized protein YaaQ